MPLETIPINRVRCILPVISFGNPPTIEMRRGTLKVASCSLRYWRSSGPVTFEPRREKDDCGGNILSQARMRHTIGRGFRYVRVPHQRVIDLDRSDFLGAAIDHLPLASMQREEPLLIEAAYIAVRPAVDERGPIELRRIEITRHHVAPINDLSCWPVRTSVDDFHDLDTVRPWNAACPGLVRPRGGMFEEISAVSLGL